MNIKWEAFEGRQYRVNARTEPRVTLGAKGTFYLNGAAWDAMKRPAAVEMLYDGNRRIIGLRPVEARQRNAFLIKPHGKSGKYRRLCAASFCQHLRLPMRETLLFDQIELDEKGVLVLRMDKTIRISRGAR